MRRSVDDILLRTSLSSSSLVEDIDAADRGRYECVVEYVDDVMQDLKKKEDEQHSALLGLPTWLEEDRSVLIDWMLAVRQKMSLRVDTYALAVGILDRFLSASFAFAPSTSSSAVVRNVNESFEENATAKKDESQRKGITVEHAAGAIMLAATLEEIFPPDTADMIQFCNQKYKKNGRRTERADRREREELFPFCEHNSLRTTSWKMASLLGFDLWTATWLSFLRRYSKASHNNTAVHDRAKAICSLLMQQYNKFVFQFKPSHIAAAAIYCANTQLEPAKKPWNKTLLYYTGYSKQQVEELVSAIDFLPFIATASASTSAPSTVSGTSVPSSAFGSAPNFSFLSTPRLPPLKPL